MDANAHAGRVHDLDAAGFQSLYQRLRRCADWGAADRRGALNHITAGTVRAAMAEVRLGRSVSLAAPVETVAGLDNPQPSKHDMISSPAEHRHKPGLNFAYDRLAMSIHGDADSHIDALCHVVYDGMMYNRVAAGSVEPDGLPSLSIDVARDGIVGRGVLLDIPRVRGVAWLEPGDHVTAVDLAAAEQAQHVLVGPGDLLFVHVGHRHRRSSLGPWDAAAARAGLHPTALEFLAERKVAVLGSDGNNDTAPAAGVAFPVHVLAINALGLHLLDYLHFADLLALCEQEERWSFLCVIAPLRLPAATGSPVNPIAVL
ncbi:cyclase family protein [Catellatospora tritici]|uniref:cyclase family protein n=1 Tax=Catellatospora tritici TaxID=2851566 RepID=UPI001C2D5000|nr:cyclase family protein [Catellatospora tritici]MBV1853716.1 cyclase family protein [Catellatospora tritici]